MEVVDRVAVLLTEQPLQGIADLGELGEQQQALALGHDLLDHLGDPLQLVGARLEEGAAVLEELGGVVADLLEPGQGGEHQPLPLDAVGRLQLALHIVHHGLVERGLFRGEVAVDLLLHLVRQVLDDALVALEPTQDEPKSGNWSAKNAKNAKQIRVLQPLQVSPYGRALRPA